MEKQEEIKDTKKESLAETYHKHLLQNVGHRKVGQVDTLSCDNLQ